MAFSMKPATTRKRLASLVVALVLATAAALTAGGATLAQADGKPARPTGLTAQADQQGVHFSWDNPGGAAVTHHRVVGPGAVPGVVSGPDPVPVPGVVFGVRVLVGGGVCLQAGGRGLSGS